MFGRYELPLWRKVTGLFLAGLFVVGLYGYVAPQLNVGDGVVGATERYPPDVACAMNDPSLARDLGWGRVAFTAFGWMRVELLRSRAARCLP